MAITFDRINKYIYITAPQTDVTIQELIDAIRDFEDDDSSMDLSSLANCSGKQQLSADQYTSLTLELLDGWKIKFEDRAGPTYVTCYITGGNLTRVAGEYPVEPSDYVFVIVSTSSGATIIEVSQEVLEDIADMVWDNPDGVSVKTRIDQSISSLQDAIQGADADTLKTISDQIDGLLNNVGHPKILPKT